MPGNNPYPIESGSGVGSLKDFLLTTETKDKSDKEYGLVVSKHIWSTANTGVGGYYYSRNARFRKNRNYANGRIDVESMFRDRFQFDAKPNYISLNWNTLQMVNRIISGLVGRWMQRNEKIQVTAIDALSLKEKQDEYESIEFMLYNREMIERLQQESGVQLIPQDQFMPENKEDLLLWQSQFQRLPEEILYEMGCNDVLGQNGWYDVLKEKMLHDAAEVLLVGTYTWMDKEGVIHVKWVKPEDAIYSYSEYPDFRDTTWRGEVPSMKISEIRKEYGKEFNPDNPLALTEQEIFDKVVPKAREYQLQTNLTWNDSWVNAYMRPYDEWNVRSMKFELKSVDSDPYTITKTKTKTTYTQKGLPLTSSGKPKQKPSEGQEVIEDKHWNIYRGVYLPDCDILLEWGLKKNMIRPQDPKEIGNAEFSYSFYMPQNFQMRNLAIPEKIEAAVDGMILALLKMQQVVARMRPTGAAIDESALQAIDYGLGEEGNKITDPKKLFDQTGDVYYRGVDAEGNRVPIPIQELANSGFLGQMQGLIQNYQFNYQILRDELGEDPNLISSALQPRVTSGNVEASQIQAEFATDYIYRAYSECMKITARKISCLLKDSVKYGAKAYRNIMNEDDIGDRQFSTDIKLLPTAQDVAKFEIMMNEAMRSTPSLVLHIDPFQLMRVAKEDVKLAEVLFRQGQRKMLQYEQQKATENQDQIIQGQIQSAQAAEEAKRQTADLQGGIDKEKVKMQSESGNRDTVLKMVTSFLTPSADGKTNDIPAELRPLVSAVIENIMVSTIAATEEQKNEIMAKIQEARMAEQQAAQQQQMQPNNIQEQPQPAA